MSNIIIETDGDRVVVNAIPGHRDAFAEAARELAANGPVTTETGDRGIVLVTDKETARKAGVVKATRRTRKAK